MHIYIYIYSYMYIYIYIYLYIYICIYIYIFIYMHMCIYVQQRILLHYLLTLKKAWRNTSLPILINHVQPLIMIFFMMQSLFQPSFWTTTLTVAKNAVEFAPSGQGLVGKEQILSRTQIHFWLQMALLWKILAYILHNFIQQSLNSGFP